MSCCNLLLLMHLVGRFTLSQCQFVPRDYGFCSQIHQMNQYCAENTAPGPTNPSTHSNPPRQGKAGPPGPPGPPGESANVDYDIVDARVDEKFAEMHADLVETLSMFEKKLQKLEDELHNLKTVEDCNSATPTNAKISNVSGGVYDIYYGSREVGEVYCDLQTEGGKWLVFQRRMDGSVDFYRSWAEYEEGFGSVAGEFWLGLRILHEILSRGKHELRIDLEDWDGNKRYAKYSTFDVGDASTDYRLTIGGYSGDAGDSLTSRSNGMKFSTKDRDLDTTSEDCAKLYKGGWWYRDCHDSNLNGLFFPGGTHTSFADGIEWNTWKGYYYSMELTEMKIRMIFIPGRIANAPCSLLIARK